MKETKCVRIADDFEPTGRLESRAWSQAHPVVFDTDWEAANRYPALATTVSCLWSLDFIYYGFHCPYATLTLFEQSPPQRVVHLYERDVAEVFLGDDERITHYKEFELSPNGHWLDLEIDWEKGGPVWDWDSGSVVAAHVDENCGLWTAELKVPVSCLLRRPVAGQVWPVNFYRVEGPGPRIYLAWSATQTAQPNYHVPDRFGRLHFVD